MVIDPLSLLPGTHRRRGALYAGLQYFKEMASAVDALRRFTMVVFFSQSTFTPSREQKDSTGTQEGAAGGVRGIDEGSCPYAS